MAGTDPGSFEIVDQETGEVLSVTSVALVATGQSPSYASERKHDDIFHPVASTFPLIPPAEFEGLVADIAENGVLEPIWLHRDGRIIDGRNRWLACQKLGIECPTRVFTKKDSNLRPFVISLNLKRRQLSTDQKGALAAEMATRRMVDSLKKGATAPAPSIEGAGMTTSDAADLFNISEGTVERAKVVMRDAPDLHEKVKAGEMTAGAARRELARRQNAAIAARECEMPKGVYRTIVIDPPWPMQKIERDVAPNQIGFEYPTMTEEQLAAFPVPDMADETCHLFLWTTQKFLPMAFRLAEAWGFTYVCEFIWHKSGGFQPFGMPQYNHEQVLYCRKGTAEFLEFDDMKTCFRAPRREHSRKPDEFYDMVRRVCAGPRIDVFSREKREGFDQYGNEAEKFAEDAA